MQPFRTFVTVLGAAVATIAAFELVRMVREHFAVDAEVRARSALNALMQRHNLDAEVRREINRLLFDLYCLEHGID